MGRDRWFRWGSIDNLFLTVSDTGISCTGVGELSSCLHTAAHEGPDVKTIGWVELSAEEVAVLKLQGKICSGGEARNE